MPTAPPPSLIPATLRVQSRVGSPPLLSPEYPAAEDYDFVLRMMRHGRARNLPRPLIKYRLHNQQQSSVARDRMSDIRRQLSDSRLGEIGIALDSGTRQALEQIIMNPEARLDDFGAAAKDPNVLMLLVQGYRLLLQLLDSLARAESPRPGELPALRQRLRERCMAAIGLGSS